MSRAAVAAGLLTLVGLFALIGRRPRRPAAPSLVLSGVQRLLVWAGGNSAVVVADPATAQAIAAAIVAAEPCTWDGEGTYRLEFRLHSGSAVWFGYDPQGTGYLCRWGDGRPRAWRPSLALRRALARYLPL